METQPGVLAMASGRFHDPLTREEAEGAEFLRGLPCLERCNLVVSLHEGKNVAVSWTELVKVSHVFDEFGELCFKRVLDSPRGGEGFLNSVLGPYSWGEFLARVRDDVNLSTFTQFLVGPFKEVERRCLQRYAFAIAKSRILEWMVRDRLYNARWNWTNTVVEWVSAYGVKLLVSEGIDLNCVREGRQALTQYSLTPAAAEALLLGGGGQSGAFARHKDAHCSSDAADAAAAA